MGVPDRLEFKSKAQAVYELLRARILDGEVEPGQALSFDGLARELGVSKIPIREAVKRLEAERLVEVVLHVGARVAPISVEQAEHVYPIRRALNELATRLAAERITSQELARLDELQAQMEAAARARDTRAIEPLNRQFHNTIARASGNPELAELYRDLMARYSRFRAGLWLTHARAAEVMREHRAIVEALRAHDPDAAVRVTREHDEHSVADVLERMRAAETAKQAV